MTADVTDPEATPVAGNGMVTTTPAPRRVGRRVREMLPLLLALLLVTVVFQSINGLFLSPRNITNLLIQVAPLALIAIGSTVMIVMGEIDLSLGSIAGFTGAVGAILLANEAIPWPVCVALAFLVGMAITGLQGVIVVVGRVKSFAVTLAGFLIWYGAQIMVLGPNGQQVLRREPVADLSLARVPTDLAMALVAVVGGLLVASWLLRARRVSRGPALAGGLVVRLAAIGGVLALVLYLDRARGVPLIFVLVLGVAALMWGLLTWTPLGRHLYAVGGNLEASREAGVGIGRVKWIGFVLAGALTTFAGFAIISYTGGADTSTGTGPLLLAAIGATVVGGVSLLGGRGSVWGAFAGAILLALVQSGLNLMSLPFYAVYIVEGVVVLAALLSDAALRRRLTT